MNRLRKAWLVVTFIVIVLIPTITAWFIQADRNTEVPANYLASAEQQIAKKNIDGALSILEFIVTNDLDNASHSALITRDALIADMTSWSRKTKDYLGGVFLGDIHNNASLLGAVSGDLCVIGDARDLLKNGYRYVTNEEISKLEVTCSTLGIAMNLAPHVDLGLSLVKEFGKFLRPAVQDAVLFSVKQAKDYGKTEKLIELATAIQATFLKVGMGTVDLFKMAKDSDHLLRMSRLIEQFGRPGYAIMLMGGRRGYEFLDAAMNLGLKVTGKSGQRFLIFALRYPLTGIRMVKIVKKLGYDHPGLTMLALADLLAILPVKIVLAASLAFWLFCYWTELLGLMFMRRETALTGATA